jgi:endoglycosylceramidase
LVLALAPCATASGCGSSSTVPAARSCTIAPPSVDWRLHADGVQLRDALGRVVVLRGVDAGGRSKIAPFVPFDYAAGGFDAALASYMDRAASWGIDAMRVPFTWAAVEPTQGTDDEEFLGRYAKIVDAAWARGIWSVVDMHQDVYADVFCGDGFPAWTIPDPKPAPHHDCPSWGQEYLGDPAVQAAFDRFWAQGSPVMAAYLAMWDRMLARFRDKPGVVGFEPINEPGWGSATIETFESTTLGAFYASMVPRMRAAAPSSLVFVDPTGFAGFSVKTSLARPPGDGVVFAPHFYIVGARQPDAVAPKLQTWASMGAAWNVPVFLGEFGTNQGGDEAAPFISAHFDALDGFGMSGTQWEYSVAVESWNGETYGIVAADGTELPVVAAIIRPFARAVAGDAITTAYDADRRVFSLHYAPTIGVTEVALPARAVPNGYDVALTGGCYDASQPGRLLVQPDSDATHVDLRVSAH